MGSLSQSNPDSSRGGEKLKAKNKDYQKQLVM